MNQQDNSIDRTQSQMISNQPLISPGASGNVLAAPENGVLECFKFAGSSAPRLGLAGPSLKINVLVRLKSESPADAVGAVESGQFHRKRKEPCQTLGLLAISPVADGVDLSLRARPRLALSRRPRQRIRGNPILILRVLIYTSSCLYDETEIKDYQPAHEISKPLDRHQQRFLF